MNRRRFLQTTLPAALAVGGGTSSCSRLSGREIPGQLGGAAAHVGHRLRDLNPRSLPAPACTVKTGVVIAGGGIAGLAAARQLSRRGLEEYLVLDLENEAGGNSASGRNEVSAYPLGAHYLPLPGPDCREVLAFLEECGILTGHDAAGRPVYDELSLCHEPQERLFIHGQWEPGLQPITGLTAREREDFAAFDETMHRWQEQRAFTLPLDRSLKTPELLELDRLTMAGWLHRQGWTSEPLRWYVDYACKDDFGGTADQVSAWAGIHYFASRSGHAANAAPGTMLTWPEGNGHLVSHLVRPLEGRLHGSSLVLSIQPQPGGGVHTLVMDAASGAVTQYESRAVVCALPHFVASRVVAGLQLVPLAYAPWVVTNLTLDELPPAPGSLPAWDSVIYRGPTLGYVNATHQKLDPVPRETVITHYEVLCGQPPAETRQWMQGQNHAFWCQRALDSLATAHPDLANHLQQADVWLWGHGMVRPEPGFIWGEKRAEMMLQTPPFFYAHSDMSGMSLFEEAYTRGCLAADAVHAYL